VQEKAEHADCREVQKRLGAQATQQPLLMISCPDNVLEAPAYKIFASLTLVENKWAWPHARSQMETSYLRGRWKIRPQVSANLPRAESSKEAITRKI